MENAQKKLDEVLERLAREQKRPRLLVHACCAPCSSYVMEYLTGWFDMTFLFYNPNMDTEEEFNKRAEELKRLIAEMNLSDKAECIVLPYGHEAFEEMAKGLEEEPERGRRCLRCYELRLRKTAEYFRDHPEKNFFAFATTLTLSPLKPADILNEIGERIGEEYGVPYLPSDFKKKNGYKRSIELSKIYNLYRQNYCGCRYSKRGNENE